MKAKSIKGKTTEEIKTALAESMAYNLRFMKKDGKLAKDIMIEGFLQNGIDWLIKNLIDFWNGINRRAFHRG